MVEVTLKDAVDGAKAVEFNDSLMAVWKGGTYVNVYHVNYDNTISEVEGFSLSDEKGQPVDRETMIEHMNEWLEQTREEHR